jgi:hypothetical protein
MANRFFLGVNGNWDDTANWSTTRGGAGGSAEPSASDDVFILDSATDITTNLTGVTAQTIKIGGDYQGNIGGSGTALTVATTTCVITVETVGRQYVNLSASTTVAQVNVNSTGSGTVNLGAGTFTDVYCGASGTLNIDGGCVVTNLYSAGMKVFSAYNGTAHTIAKILGGVGHEIRRAVTTLTLGGGATTYNAVTLTTANVQRGGSLNHTSNGTITTLEVQPGGSTLGGFLPFTVTNSTKYEGGSLFPNTNQVTYTNATTIIGRSGR